MFTHHYIALYCKNVPLGKKRYVLSGRGATLLSKIQGHRIFIQWTESGPRSSMLVILY